MIVSYKFVFSDGTEKLIEVLLDRGPPSAALTRPAWTALGFRQCPNCPLKPEQVSHCPAALDLAPTIIAFAEIISHDRAQVVVETPERVVGKECQVQTALQSVVALIMATSGCPILGRMRGLAYTHLPFATMDESMFRVLGGYLLRQLLLHRNGGEADWELEGLKAHYADLEILNRAFKSRVDAASEQDSTINAVAALGVLSMGIGFSIDDQLPELARLGVG
jgi:hypothetical protein